VLNWLGPRKPIQTSGVPEAGRALRRTLGWPHLQPAAAHADSLSLVERNRPGCLRGLWPDSKRHRAICVGLRVSGFYRHIERVTVRAGALIQDILVIELRSTVREKFLERLDLCGLDQVTIKTRRVRCAAIGLPSVAGQCHEH
jgi:hypothetical protein